MITTISTIDGPQLTMDAVDAVKLLLKLPLTDYAITFQPGGNVMITPDTDKPIVTEAERQAAPATKSFDQLRRETGAGGFVSVASICGIVGKPRRRRSLYRHALHAGR